MDAKYGNILLKAHELINGERLEDYNTDECFKHIAELWTIYLDAVASKGIVINPHEVAIMMALLKIAREMNKHKEDSLIDCAGYIALANDLVEK